MYQSGRAGDEAKTRKSPAKSRRVGITGLGYLWRIEQCMSWVIYGTLNSVYIISLQVVKWIE